MDFTELLTNLEHYLYVMAIAMVPIIELKGAMPIGLAFGLGTWKLCRSTAWFVPARAFFDSFDSQVDCVVLHQQNLLL